MASIRLSGLTIFLILLAVILVGYVLHHTWENFTSCNKEGFTLDYKESTIASDALNGKYSQNSKTIAKLAEKLYYDPVTRVLIEYKPGTEGAADVLNMKRKDGYDYNYTVGDVNYEVTKLGKGAIGNTNLIESSITLETIKTALKLTAETTVNLGHAKEYFKFQTGPTAIYMAVYNGDNALPTTDNDPITNMYTYSDVNSTEVSTSGVYPDPQIDTESDTERQIYKRVLQSQGVAVSELETGAPPKIFGWKTPNGLAVVYLPLFVNGAQTNTVFIHVMDTIQKTHLGTYYFQGNQVEMYNYTSKAISTDSFPTDTNAVGASESSTEFSGDISSMHLPNNATGEKLYTDVYHDSAKGLVYFAARVNNDAIRCYIKIGPDFVPIVVKSETSAGVTSDDSVGTNTSGTSGTSGTTGTITELTNALNLIQTIQNTFGSSDSNYLLKTEVVPPVCPACPSCSSSNGVCTNCGGNGGSGTQSSNGSSSIVEKAGSGATNLIRDGADGATNLARDAASGTYEVGKEVVTGTGNAISNTASGVGQFAKDTGSGVYNAAKDTGSGVGQFAKDTGSGIGQFAKDTGSGVYNAAKEVGSGAYGVAQDVTSGTIGLGREMAGGVGNMFSGPGVNNGGYNNSYGGPSYGYNNGGYNQGGYMAPQQPATAGQDPYSYYGAVPPRYGGCNYMPRTADFSNFGR
jgi:hypothetical protein